MIHICYEHCPIFIEWRWWFYCFWFSK